MVLKNGDFCMDTKNEELFKRYLNPTRGSHYVKREYLSNWSSDGTHILTCRDKTNFVSNNLKDVCTERDMYKMEKLTNLELMQVQTFYKNSKPRVKEINDSFIGMWQLACSIMENKDNPEDKNLANKIAIQCGEDLQSNFESTLDDCIKKCLLNCEESFLDQDDKLLNFGLYLFSQYLRTQKQKNKVINNLENANHFENIKGQLNPEKLWKVLIIIMTNMASYELLSRKETNHICFIKSNQKALITSDQPVVNIAKDIDHDYVKFYYPISPSVSIIFPVEKFSIIEDDISLIKKMNDVIINNSYRMFFKLK
ncbi:MAG: DUF4238 domain-containing protein [Bacilli bacterium]|nr:DUF4238 domain-containing protein [Bacilli bacterium]MBR1582005.1 DUF4238 domain-containing protein [Bacilli bacterium]